MMSFDEYSQASIFVDREPDSELRSEEESVESKIRESIDFSLISKFSKPQVQSKDKSQPYQHPHSTKCLPRKPPQIRKYVTCDRLQTSYRLQILQENEQYKMLSKVLSTSPEVFAVDDESSVSETDNL